MLCVCRQLVFLLAWLGGGLGLLSPGSVWAQETPVRETQEVLAEGPEDTAEPQADVEEIIAEGQDALGGWISYPWYDSKTDDFRSIAVKPPSAPVNSANFTWVGWFFSALAWIFHFFIWWILLPGIAIALVYFLVRAFLDGEKSGAVAITQDENERNDLDRVEALPVRVRPRMGDLLAEAHRLYEEGNFAEAIIYLYSHQLVTLDKKHLIHLAKGKTNRQYLREVRSSGALREMLEQTMLTFEDVFFGGHELGRARFEKCWHRLGQFDSLLEGGTG